MIRHAKRNLGVISALVALVESIVLLLVNGLFLVDKILDKLDMDAGLSENLVSFDMDPYTTKLSEDGILFTIFYSILFVIGLILLISAIKFLKKPINKKGNITYKTGLSIFMILLSAVVLGIVFVGYTSLADYNFVDIDKMNIFCFLNIGLTAVSIILLIISFFIKTNVFNLNTKVKPVAERQVEVSTLYAYDKLQKIQQLYDLGAISEQTYKEATAKYSQGV